jgi:hypothetical protein
MVKAGATTVSTGSIASDLRAGSTKSANAYSTLPTMKIGNDWSIACTKSMKNVGSNVGTVKPIAQQHEL